MSDAEIIEWFNGIEDNFKVMSTWSDLAKKDRGLVVRIHKSITDRLTAAILSPEVVEDRNRRWTERAIAAGNLTGDELKLVNEINTCGDHVVVVKWARNMVHDQMELYRKIFPAIQQRYFQAVDSDEWKRYAAENT